MSPKSLHIQLTHQTCIIICIQIQEVFRTIGSCLINIINGITTTLFAAVDGIVTVLNLTISFLTCGAVKRRRI